MRIAKYLDSFFRKTGKPLLPLTLLTTPFLRNKARRARILEIL
jgi:hypothetical protein